MDQSHVAMVDANSVGERQEAKLQISTSTSRPFSKEREMPPQRTTKSKDESKSYPRPPKKLKPTLPVEKQMQKRWKSMKDQIGDGYLENALKSCKKGRVTRLHTS